MSVFTAENKIRREARARLAQAHWSVAVAVTVLFLCAAAFFFVAASFAVSFWPNAATAALAVVLALALLAMLPLQLGLARWCALAANGEEASPMLLFTYYRSPAAWGRALAVTLRRMLWRLLWLVVCLLPGGALLGVAYQWPQAPFLQRQEVMQLCLIGGWVLVAAGAVAGIWMGLRYFAVSYLAATREELSPQACIRLSRQVMKGHKSAAFRLLITYVLWVASCFFILPLLVVVPYMGVGTAVCAKWLTQLWQNTRKESEANRVDGGER